MTWQGNSYGKIVLAGQIELTNRKDQPVAIEVVRHVLGMADDADNDGQVVMSNVLEDTDAAPQGERPYWWGWYSWPSWWAHFNGLGAITWTAKLEPGKSITLKYGWHYYWR